MSLTLSWMRLVKQVLLYLVIDVFYFVVISFCVLWRHTRDLNDYLGLALYILFCNLVLAVGYRMCSTGPELSARRAGNYDDTQPSMRRRVSQNLSDVAEAQARKKRSRRSK